MPRCAKCAEEKARDCFGKDRARRSGLNPYCKECARKLSKAWAKNNPEQNKNIKQRYLSTHREKRLETCRTSRKRCLNREHPNRPAIVEQNIEAMDERKYGRQRRYRAKHQDRMRASRRAYQKRRRLDASQRAVDAIRRRIRHVMNGNAKGSLRILGYTADELRGHLESLFKSGMTWANYGHVGDRWHVDHKIPVSAFAFPQQLTECFALTNLQPMWAFENLRKHDRV